MTAAAPIQAHAEYGASSADRWTSCLGSPRLAAGLVSPDNDWNIDGTIAHKLMEQALLNAVRDARSFDNVPMSANGYAPVSDDHARAVQVLLDYVYGILDRYPDARLFVEQRVHVPSQAVPGRMWGTADVLIYVPSQKWVFVIDYKHGVGITILPHESKQIKFYGVGAMFFFEGEPIAGFTLAIVQPRSYSTQGGVKDVDITYAELMMFHNHLEERAYLTLDPHAPLVPDPEYCRWCPAGAAMVCPVAERTALAIVDGRVQSLAELSKDTLPEPSKLALSKIHYILSVSKLMTGFLKSVKEMAVGYMRQGNVFPGWKLVFSQARRIWDPHKPAIEIATMLSILTGKTIDEVYPRTLIGITEAENLVVDAYRNGVPALLGETKKAHTGRLNEASEKAREAMALLTLKQPGGGVEIVPISDPRPAIDGAAAYFAGRVNLEGL